MADPLSIVAISISSLFSIVYTVKKVFKKFKSSKCHTNLHVDTTDGKQHQIEFKINKSIRNLEDIIKNLETKITTIEQNNTPPANGTEN